MPKSFLFPSRARRFFVAGLAGGALMIPIIGVILTIQWGLLVQPASPQAPDTLSLILHSWVFISSVLIAFAVVALKWYFTYRKLIYDPTWVLKYQETFDAMSKQRSAAAKTLKKYRGQLSDIQKHRKALSNIDDVLDVLSDIAFYTKGDQISPEVAHNHFYHWLRGYWISAKDYVDAYQAEEPKAWEGLGDLFETLCAIEAEGDEKTRQAEHTLPTDKMDKFLHDEMGLCEKDGIRSTGRKQASRPKLT